MNMTHVAGIIGVLALAGAVSAGWAAVNPTTTEHQATSPASRHPAHPKFIWLKTDGISIRVPKSWHLGQQVAVFESPSTGLDAGFLVPEVPKNSVALTHDPRNQSPYFTETIEIAGQTAFGDIDEVSAAGNYYHVQLQVPKSAMAALRQALRTVTLPPVATVTQAVHLAELRARIGAQLWLTTAAAANTQWVLEGGAVATAQQPFYLFRTSDGGKHWCLINYTSTPPHIFPDVAGTPHMLFWSARDGVMAEVTGWSHDVWIYGTRDGGQTWALQKVALPSQPNAQKTLKMAWAKSGILTISVPLQSGTTCQLTSQDSGRTWTA